MHNKQHRTHHRHTFGKIPFFRYHHFFQKYFWIFKMTICEWGILGTVQRRTIHTVRSMYKTMKTGTIIADVPHPTEHRRYVRVLGAKAKYGKYTCQYWTDENSHLIKRDKTYCWKVKLISYYLLLLMLDVSCTVSWVVVPIKNPQLWAHKVAIKHIPMK